MATLESLTLVLPALPCTHTLVSPILGEKEDPSDATRAELSSRDRDSIAS